MFKKKEMGTINITNVEDSEDGEGARRASSSSSSTSPSTQAKDGSDEKKEKACKPGVAWREVALYNRWVRLGYLALLCVILGLIIPYLLASFAFPLVVNTARGSCFLNISYRFECLPGASSVLTEKECRTLGCCYDSTDGDLYAPTCFHSIPSEYGYLALNVSTSSGTFRSEAVPQGGARGGIRKVYRLSTAGEISLELGPLRETTNFDTEAWSLRARVQRGGSDVVRVLIYSPENDHFFDDFAAEPATSYQLDVTVTQDPGGDFNITVTRVATGEEVLETVFGPMIYGEDYAELTTRLPTQHLYGLGLRRNFDFFPNYKQRERWALFTEEKTTMAGNTSVATGNSGAHPFFMNFEKTPGYMYGLYLKTSAPVEVSVIPVPAVVFRGVGTLWDLRIMAGPTPRDVSRQYTKMVGRPSMPPYWALGYHLCRAAAPDLSVYDKVVELMKEARIPYESDCIDARLNYPNTFTPLTTEAQQRVTALQDEGRKFTLVQYPFVRHGSGAYNDSEGFLLKFNDSSDYFGEIEGLAVGYPDYANENTLPLWLSRSSDVAGLYGSADGVFLLNNSPLNQALLNYTNWNGTVTVTCTPETPDACCPDPALPFLPSGVKDINNHSLCVALVHPSLKNILHLHVHNTYGLYHHRRIRAFMKESAPKKRPFVSSQSTHAGTGVEGAAFGESFGANFMEQKLAVVQVLELGLYGVPLAGLPVCGSRNDSNGELKSEWCLRGHQMAAFWPLMVSHYEYGHQARSPVDFDDSFAHLLAVFIRLRYTLLPYFYTLLYEASVEGTPVARPLFYEFPEDEGSRQVSTQFMVGGGLLVSPILQSVGEQDSIDALLHLPPGRWYDFFSGSLVAESTNGTDRVIPTLLADVNVHVRGGAILPLQGILHDWANTTENSRLFNFTLIVALCCNDSSTVDVDGVWAQGSLYLDDGVTPLDQDADPSAEHLEMTATGQQVTVTRTTPVSSSSSGLCTTDFTYSTVIDSVLVFGIPFGVNKVTVNGVTVTSGTKQDLDSGTLTINELGYDWCSSSSLVVTWRS